jgi:hypothetical protein
VHTLRGGKKRKLQYNRSDQGELFNKDTVKGHCYYA